MTETQTPTAEESRTARRESRRTWYGYLSDETVEHIAERIRNLLTGRRYTFVSLNTTQTRTMPEVRTGQRMTPEKHVRREAVSVHRIGEPLDYAGAEPDKAWESCGLSVADTYGVWGMHASHATEADAYKDSADPEKAHRATYVTIEGGRSDDPRDVGRRDRIEVIQYNGLNPPERLHWVIAIEPPPDVRTEADRIAGEVWAWFNRHDAPWSPSDATVNDLAFKIAGGQE